MPIENVLCTECNSHVPHFPHIAGAVPGPQYLKALERPNNFFELEMIRQWEIDKQLGILDWSGNYTE
jgi:hypothetical protein